MYIYNFLDFRSQTFGRRMLNQIDLQLSGQFEMNGVRTERLMFRDSTVGIYYPERRLVIGESYDRVPVIQTINSNHREAAFGARYRLIVFPSDFQVDGAWQSYKISWMLVDVPSGATLWSFVTTNRRLMLWRNDENSVRRGRALIDEVVADLQANNIL